MTAKQLEKRLEEVERELAELKDRMEKMNPPSPWWERVAGTFHEDPVYQEAMKLGREYRVSSPSDHSAHGGE